MYFKNAQLKENMNSMLVGVKSIQRSVRERCITYQKKRSTTTFFQTKRYGWMYFYLPIKNVIKISTLWTDIHRSPLGIWPDESMKLIATFEYRKILYAYIRESAIASYLLFERTRKKI